MSQIVQPCCMRQRRNFQSAREHRPACAVNDDGASWRQLRRAHDEQSDIDKVASGGYYAKMRAVGLKILKNKLSEYVRLAAGGETVLVTDRDRVVAEIVPPQSGRSPLLGDAMLAEAVRAGFVTPPVLTGNAPPPRKPVMAFQDLMHDLRHDRENR